MIRTHLLPCHLPKHESDALNRESGRLYTKTLVTHYRVYRKKGTKRRHWLSRGAAERLGDYLMRDDPPLLHAHSKDAAQQGFYKAITTARANRQLGAKFPYRRKRWRTTIWKETGIRVEETETGTLLLLARARGLAPIRVRLPTAITMLPCWRVREVRLVWDRAARHYAWHVVVEDGQRPAPPPGTAVVAVDLGEVHPAACTDGTETVIIAARRVRATQQYTAKRLAALRRQQDHKRRGSRRWWKLQRRKNRFLAQQRRRVRDLEHTVSRAVVAFAVERRAGTLALGDVRTVADGKRLNRKNQQKVSTWSHGRQRQYITSKAEAAGIRVVLVDEAARSQTCPNPDCKHRYKPQGRVYRCPACGLRAPPKGHPDAVGAANLLSRFLYGAVGQIRPPPQTTYRRPAVIMHGKRRVPACGCVVPWTRGHPQGTRARG